MSYNKAKEEKKWKKWKEKEERLLRECGVNENAIAALRKMDWEAFNSERRYLEHRVLEPIIIEQVIIEPTEPEIWNVNDMVDAVENEQLLHILLESDRKTLQYALMKMMGFTAPEISVQTGATPKTIYCRLDRLKKKIKKII